MMTPAQLDECLSVVRWTPDTLAQALRCDVSLVHAWLDDMEDIPPQTSAWIEMMALMHEKAELIRPVGLEGKRAREH